MSMKVALDLVPEKIEALLKDYERDIEQAWLKAEKDLTMSFGVSFGVKQGQNTCTCTMSFTKEKIKDEVKFTWDDKQQALPLKKKDKEKEK